MSDRALATWQFVGTLGMLVLIGCAGAFPISVAGAEADLGGPADVAALVEQLGDPAYAKRCEASERLLKIGVDAGDGLLRGVENPDPEISRKCRWLLAELRVADLHRRIDAFAADKEGKQEHHLPYWDKYRKIVGDDRVARSFFLEMLKAEGPLLEVASQGEDSALAAVNARWIPLLQHARYGQNVEKLIAARDVAAWLLVLSDSKPLESSPVEDPFSEGDPLARMLDEVDLRKWLAQSASREPLRKILGHWALSASTMDQVAQRLRFTVRYGLKESLVLAAVVIQSKDALTFESASLAAAAVGLQGGKPYVAMLEPLLAKEDLTQTWWGANLQKTVEVRDIALAWMVELTGQEPVAYGMPDFKEALRQLRADPRSVNNVQGYGYYVESTRETAIAKWRDYVAAHPLPKAPVVDIPADLADRLKQGKDAADRDIYQEESIELLPDQKELGPAAEDAAPAGEKVPLGATPEENQPAPPQAIQAAPIIVPQPGALPALPVFRPGEPADDSQSVEDSAEDAPIANLRAAWADRDAVRKLRAAEELVATRRYGQAARYLDEVLEDAAGKLFLRSQDRRVASSLQIVAEQTLSSLPGEGLLAYQTQCRVKARRMLAEAVSAGDGVLLAALADRYFFTPSGAEASLLVALGEMDRGEYVRAALRLDKLRRMSPDAARLEPQLSLRAAECLLAAGDAQGVSRVLAELERISPGVKPAVAGRAATSLPAAGSQLRWFEAITLWRGAGGDARHAARVVSGVPLLRGKAVDGAGCDAIPLAVREKIDKQQRDNFVARLPSAQPVVVGQTAVFRSPTRLMAVDVISGKTLWQAPVEDGLRWFFEGRALTDRALRSAKVLKAAEQRLFGDTKYGAVVCDSRRVFGIEGAAVDLPAIQRITLRSDGKLRLDAGGSGGFNYLTAYDVHSGKLAWSLGGPPKNAAEENAVFLAELRANFGIVRKKQPSQKVAGNAAEIDLSGAVFLGAPLCWDGRLLAVVACNEDISLAEIDARCGKTISLLPMTAIETTSEGYDNPCISGEIASALLGGRAQGSAYADGILVCGIGAGRFAAVDIANRRLLWACTFPEESAAANPANVWMGDDEAVQQTDPPGWLDAAIKIVGDRVILMPHGADRLDALNLATGAVAWSAAREDGVFCDAPSGDVLLIVGRGGVRAIRPSDGKPLWDGRRIDYPTMGVVCGRGVVSESGYCIPLSSGEILVVDAARGRVVGRSRTLAADPPGNLLACGDFVLSCGAYGAAILPTVSKSQLAETAAGSVDDVAESPLLRAERLMAMGRSLEAARILKACLAENPSEDVKRMLCDVLLDGLAAEDEGCEQFAAACEPLLSGRDAWSQIAWETAAAMDRRGLRSEAFDAYLRCMDAVKNPEAAARLDALRTQSVFSRVTPRLEDLYRAATDDQRAAMDRQIGRQRSALDAHKFVTRFGWHKSAADARLELAKKAIAVKPSAFWATFSSALGSTPQGVKARLEADFALRSVLAEGARQQQCEAAARLAALFASANRNAEAAWWYCRMRDEMGDEACLDGKTGKELFEGLKADSPVRVALDRKASWPTGKVRTAESHSPVYIGCAETLNACAADGRMDPRPQLVIDRGSSYVGARDGMGGMGWKTSISRSGPAWISYSRYSNDQRTVGWWTGNLLVLSMDGMVCAVDGYGREEMVWSQPLKTAAAWSMFGPAAPQDLQRAPASQAIGLSPSRRAVCFMGQGGLTAVDALSGKVLWIREDFPTGCDLFGDDEMLLVTPPDAAEAMVLRVSDGRDLGRRHVGPMENRLWTIGRKVVSFAPGDERPELAMQDAWTGETLWKRSFSAGAKAWLIDGDEAAVMEREGRFVVVRLADGADAIAAQADPAEKLESIYAFRASDRYILIANGAVAWAKAAPLQSSGEELAPVNGRLYGFARADGKRLWASNVVQQAMQLGQDAELPILVFVNSGQRVEEESKTVCYQKLHVLDTRTGATIYRRVINSPYGMRAPGMESDYAAKTIKLGSDWGSVSLTFSEDPP